LHLTDAKKQRRTRLVYGVIAGCVLFLFLVVVISAGGKSVEEDMSGGGSDNLPDHLFTAQKMIDLFKSEPDLSNYLHNNTNTTFLQ